MKSNYYYCFLLCNYTIKSIELPLTLLIRVRIITTEGYIILLGRNLPANANDFVNL